MLTFDFAESTDAEGLTQPVLSQYNGYIVRHSTPEVLI